MNSPMPLAAEPLFVLSSSHSKGEGSVWVTTTAFFHSWNKIHALTAFAQSGSSGAGLGDLKGIWMRYGAAEKAFLLRALEQAATVPPALSTTQILSSFAAVTCNLIWLTDIGQGL